MSASLQDMLFERYAGMAVSAGNLSEAAGASATSAFKGLPQDQKAAALRSFLQTQVPGGQEIAARAGQEPVGLSKPTAPPPPKPPTPPAPEKPQPIPDEFGPGIVAPEPEGPTRVEPPTTGGTYVPPLPVGIPDPGVSLPASPVRKPPVLKNMLPWGIPGSNAPGPPGDLMPLLVSGGVVDVGEAMSRAGNRILGGDPGETISSRAGRGAMFGSTVSAGLCSALDLIDPGHCSKAVLAHVRKSAIVTGTVCLTERLARSLYGARPGI